MITVIIKKNTEYIYSGVQYNELTANILNHHVSQGELLLDVEFKVSYHNERMSSAPGQTLSEVPRLPNMIYNGDPVEPALVEQAKLQTDQWKVEQRIEEIVVTVGGKNYSGSVKSQNEIMFAIQVLTNKSAGETLVRRAIDGSVNKLDLDNFKAIEGAISDKQEIFLAGSTVATRQLLIDELIGQSALTFITYTTTDRNGMTDFIANGTLYTLTGKYISMPHGRDLYNSVGETGSDILIAVMISKHINQGTFFDPIDNLFRS